MESYEAIETAIQRNTPAHARALGLSTSMVNKWQEPSTDYSESGAYNPLDRIKMIMDTAFILKTPKEDALMPLQWLAQAFDHVAIPVQSATVPITEMQQQMCKAIKEFGDLAGVGAKAFADNKLTLDEKKQIRKEGWELVIEVVTFLKMVER